MITTDLHHISGPPLLHSAMPVRASSASAGRVSAAFRIPNLYPPDQRDP